MNLTDILIAFFMSMLPVIELRGGIVYAAARGIPFIVAFIVCFLGSIFPVPFIFLFLRKIFAFLGKFKYTKPLVVWLEKRARSKESSVQKRNIIGLLLFVALPLPGTGAWTGALIAVVLDMRIKNALPPIILGVLIDGIIMSILSFLIPGLFFPS